VAKNSQLNERKIVTKRIVDQLALCY
jgi:hypothetical protein